MAKAKTKVLEFKELNLWERSYIPEVIRGLVVTSKQFFKNFPPTEKRIKEGKTDITTIQYPDVKRVYPKRYRGEHRLMLRDNGEVRCVACMCCSTVCPANCIHIEAAEHKKIDTEKYPKIFVIDELRCIVCGLCVEACPCDAIRMDTGIHCTPFYERKDALFDKKHLMKLGEKSIAVQGGKIFGK